MPKPFHTTGATSIVPRVQGWGEGKATTLRLRRRRRVVYIDPRSRFFFTKASLPPLLMHVDKVSRRRKYSTRARGQSGQVLAVQLHNKMSGAIQCSRHWDLDAGKGGRGASWLGACSPSGVR